MYIPLDNLYHWIRSCSVEPLSIYTFRPHGSKNIVDLNFFEAQDLNVIAPGIVCHDQEPLNFETHSTVDSHDLYMKTLYPKCRDLEWYETEQRVKQSELFAPYYKNLNLYSMLRVLNYRSIFDRYILLHSEKNSRDVEQFSHTAEPVYYWCHGIIARDWYRFAKHDARLAVSKPKQKTFLIYCRAWTGTREYRLKFLELLSDQKMLDRCQTSILHQDQGIELSSYVCADPQLQPTNIKHINDIDNNASLSHASADYCADDFVSTDISVVLETVAAESKIHLTEKTLRPIACGHPFLLMAGPGSLEYLRSYGFETFAPWLDESYDLETDVVLRMKMIVTEMSRIENLPGDQKKQILKQIKKIAKKNKVHFFSVDFFNRIRSELIENLDTAVQRVKTTKGRHFLATRALTLNKLFQMNQESVAVTLEVTKVLRRLRRDPATSIKKIIDQFPDEFFIA